MAYRTSGLSMLQRIGLMALPIGIALASPVNAQDAAGAAGRFERHFTETRQERIRAPG